MWLLVGLGNPGSRYAKNRHNIGFMAVDDIIRRHDFSGWSAKFQGEFSSGMIGGQKVLALKPLTFMNLSGQSVAATADFYKIGTDKIIVFHDELDLLPGKMRVKKGGGSGGHNGIKSIDQHLGPDYWRVRMGIGHPGHPDLVSAYVLNDFAKDDFWLEGFVTACAKNTALLLDGQTDAYMTKVAHDSPPPTHNKKEGLKDGI
jgi:PTH1 family peptidyl-tRNA hydrolase